MSKFAPSTLVNKDGTVSGVRLVYLNDAEPLKGRWYFPLFEARNVREAKEMYLKFLAKHPEIQDQLPNINEVELIIIEEGEMSKMNYDLLTEILDNECDVDSHNPYVIQLHCAVITIYWKRISHGFWTDDNIWTPGKYEIIHMSTER